MWFSPDDESMPIEDLTLVMLAGDGVSFEDVSASRGLDAPGSWRSLVATDHNGDGVLDLLASQVTERPSLWLSDGCTAPGWLAVEAPLHARVEVETSAGVQTAWVTTESAYGAARPPEAWFGLGAHQQVDRVTVTLLDGRSAWFEDLGARRRISA